MARGSVIRRVSKAGVPSYAIKYRLPDGTQKWETVGRTKKAAERALADRLAAINNRTYRELSEATFEQFAAKWIAFMAPRIKGSTLDGYGRYLANHLIPAFGSYPLQAITTGQIQEFVAGLQARGLSGKSINNYLVVLRKLFSDAVKWGYLAASPAAGIERAKVERHEMAALAPEQVQRLLAAADPEHWLLFTVAVFTGLRRGELLALQWGDIDWTASRIHVRRSLWRGEFVGPKTPRAVRSVDLAPKVLAALREARPMQPAEDIAGQLIFSNANGKPLDPDNMVRRAFKPVLAKAELPSIRWHDLRHTYASLQIAAGAHPKYVQDQLGHASITTTLDRYGHLLPGAYAHGGEQLERTVLGDSDLPRP